MNSVWGVANDDLAMPRWGWVTPLGWVTPAGCFVMRGFVMRGSGTGRFRARRSTGNRAPGNGM